MMRRHEIERLLPAVLQRAQPPSSPLAALLDVMESLHAPDEAILSDLVLYFNPRSTEPRLLPMLAHWVNLERIYPQLDHTGPGPDWTVGAAPTATGRVRELVALAPRLAQLRGTADGLKLFLRAATGLPVRIDEPVLDENGVAIPFHVRIAVPDAARPDREIIERIVALEIPAYITYELAFEESPKDSGGQHDQENEDGA